MVAYPPVLTTLAPAAPQLWPKGFEIPSFQPFQWLLYSRALLILAGLPLAFPKRELVSHQQLSHDLDNRLTESEVIYGVRKLQAEEKQKCSCTR